MKAFFVHRIFFMSIVFLWPAAATANMDTVSLLPRTLGSPAAGIEKFGAFGSMAILHDGRIKPMETFSRHLLLQWSGQQAYAGRPALSILAEILFVNSLKSMLRILAATKVQFQQFRLLHHLQLLRHAVFLHF